MQIQFLDEVESMHQWMDDDGKVQSITVKADAGAILSDDVTELVDSAGNAKPVADLTKWFKRMVKTEHAIELGGSQAPMTREQIEQRLRDGAAADTAWQEEEA